MPFTEADFKERRASQEMLRIKEVEDLVLNFKKEGVKTYVISCGVIYGQGEEVFNSHFQKAWLQVPQKLPIVGEGNNLVPTIHVTDLARMVKKVHEAPPEQQYIFGIDNTKKPTQRKLISAISEGIGTGLVECDDIPIEFEPVHPKLTPILLEGKNWKRFLMLNIKATPSKLFVKETEEGAEGGEGDGAEFNWHCKNGLAANIQLVKKEFCDQRTLKPFKTFITGKPCSGKSHFAQ
jgi:adenylate kinase